MTLGQFIRQWRLNVMHMTNREFCLKHNIPFTRWIVIEKDLARPSSLEALAKVLAIDEHTEDYRQLQQLYFAHEPRVLDEKELNGMMPALCRLDGEQWQGLRQSLEAQMHTAIAGNDPL